MAKLRSIGVLSAMVIGIGAAGASAAPLMPSAASVPAESHVQKVGYSYHYRGGHYQYRSGYYHHHHHYDSRDYYWSGYYAAPYYAGGYHRSYYYYDPPYVYGGVGAPFVILGSGRPYHNHYYGPYLRHW